MIPQMILQTNAPQFLPSLAELLVMFAITFGAMNKLPKSVYFLADGTPRTSLVGRLFACPYCFGFHAGWMTWILSAVATGTPIAPSSSTLTQILLYAFSGAAAGYLLDALAAAAERHAR